MTGLAEAVQGAVGQPASVRIGVVQNVDPLEITAQGVVFEDVGFLGSYRPLVGQTVALLGQSSGAGSDPASWLALGSIHPEPVAYQSAEELVTFGAATSNVHPVVFPRPFPPGRDPNVFTNISTGAGGIALWQSRAINIGTNGFDIFVYTTGGAVAWNNVPVGWHAVLPTI